MSKTIEQKVSETVLQKEESIEIGGVTYKVAPPSIATLILVSERVSKLPKMPQVKDGESVDAFSWVMQNAEAGDLIAGILAILILGARGLTEIKDKVFNIGDHSIKLGSEEIDRFSELKKEILNIRPSIAFATAMKLLARMEIGDFFQLTTFLSDLNIIKPTRGVGLIASGD